VTTSAGIILIGSIFDYSVDDEVSRSASPAIAIPM
jgi:hypothetical protein